jgi:radial spoke head protein 4A
LEKHLNWAKNNTALVKVPDEPPEDNGVKIPDFLDNDLYKWGGISIGKTDAYRLYLSVKKFAETLPGDVDKIRFFGRIHTRGYPYYILEGLSTEDEEGIDESKQEGRGGINKYAYWVIQDVESAQWMKLPNVSMEHITKSRLFKRILTGNLENSVPSYPPFPGKEKHLLRAIIALIVGETSISPDGFYALDDNDPPMVKSAEQEDFNNNFPKSASDLKEPDAWKHHEIEINKIGRITALPEQLDENGEPIVPDEPVDVNPALDAIKPENWSIRTTPGGAGFSANSAVVLRSLRWPGAVAVAAGRKYINVYIGDGLPYSSASYSIPLPALIQSEFSVVGADGAPAQGLQGLVEQIDIRVDPTPPVPEGENPEE